MFTSDTLADKAGAILFEKTEERLKTLLAEHGVSEPGELPRATQAQFLQRATVEAAAASSRLPTSKCCSTVSAPSRIQPLSRQWAG